MRMTPIDSWIQKKLDGQSLHQWQLAHLQQTLSHAKNSSYYNEKLAEQNWTDWADFYACPTMSAEDLVREGTALLCVPPQEIARIVTQQTSGSTGNPKRLCFTPEDLELTIDFFAHGLCQVLQPGDTLGVMMPANAPDGLGDLICRGAERIPAKTVRIGLLRSFEEAAEMICRQKVTALVGLPVQILALARYLRLSHRKTQLKNILLSADSIPTALVQDLESMGLSVFKHFGMTETGYGCAVECDAQSGQHIRENDLLVEILDPKTGERLPDGEWGEIVITTLTRKGMPLIRYRTGDRSRICPGVCQCGSSLRRLDEVRRLSGAGVKLPHGVLTMPELDERLFSFSQVMDFTAEVHADTLSLKVITFADLPALNKQDVYASLQAISALRNNPVAISIQQSREYVSLYQGKRLIL